MRIENEITLLSLSDPRWMGLIAAHPQAQIFHHPAWMRLLNECYGYEAAVFALIEDDHVTAGLPFMRVQSWLTGSRMVCLPFSDFCQPLAVDEAASKRLLAGIENWRRQHGGPQIHVHWRLPETQAVQTGGEVFRHVTPLSASSEAVFNQLSKSRVQRHIRRAEKEGVQIARAAAWEDMQIFYDLLLQTRRRLGVPIQPLKFFRLLWRELIAKDMGFVLLARKDRQPLAGALFLRFNQTLTYKYGASDSACWRYRPNHLLFWHALRWGCDNDMQLFDWGRTDLTDAGLREFKEGWGSQEQIVRYSLLSNQRVKTSARMGGGRLLAPVLQRSPAWVCRLTGELLYRHFG